MDWREIEVRIGRSAVVVVHSGGVSDNLSVNHIYTPSHLNSSSLIDYDDDDD